MGIQNLLMLTVISTLQAGFIVSVHRMIIKGGHGIEWDGHVGRGWDGMGWDGMGRQSHSDICAAHPIPFPSHREFLPHLLPHNR